MFLNTKKLTICIDARMINHSGIGVYIQYYTKYLINTSRFNISIIGNKNSIEKSLGPQSTVRFIHSNLKIYSIAELLIMPFLIPKCDVFWSPHYNSPIFPTRAGKTLLTIPDLAHISMADFMGFSLLMKIYSHFLIYFGLFKSNYVTTISEFSKNEILKYSDIRNKIKVISLGVDLSKFTFKNPIDNFDSISTKYNIPIDYILFVGNVKPHKNLKNLIYAFEEIIKSNSEIHLVIIGKKDGFITGDTELFDYINKNKKLESKIKFTGYVEDQDLPLIYRHSKIFAFPSLYEGFGFPPLEAMASGCPVIASTAASIPEICGDAVLYFDPLDPKQIANSITLFLESEILRNEYVIKGLNHVEKYNWEDSGKEFLKVIETL